MTARRVATAPEDPRLALGWLLLGTAAFAAALLFAVLLVLARTPFTAAVFSGFSFFGPSLVLHVNLSIGVWFLAMAAAVWAFALPRAGALAWTAVAVAAVGCAAMLTAPLAGGSPVLNDYVPILDNAPFLFGIAAFGAAVVAAAVRFLIGAWSLRPGRLGPDELFGLRSVAVAVVAGAVVFGTGMGRGADFQAVAWAGGHALQTAYALLAVLAWLLLARTDGIRVPPRAGMPWFGIGLLAVAANVALVWVDDPQLRSSGYTAVMEAGGWLVFLPAAWGLLTAARRCGVRLSPPLAWSIGLFAAGAVAGSLIRGDSLLVPAHYHGVIGAVTLALMALALRLSPVLGLPAPGRGTERRVARLYGGGTLLLVIGFGLAGLLGVARKTPGGAGVDGLATAAMGGAGIGGALALVGALLFCLRFFRAVRAQRTLPAGGVPRGVEP